MYTIAVINFQGLHDNESNHENSTTKNLLDFNYQIYYGKKSKQVIANQIVVKLDEIGEVAVLFETQNFSAQDFSVLDLSIDNLPINYRPFLMWQTKQDQQPHQIELFQPNGKIKSNLLSRNPNWKGDIVQFGIRIAPQTHLGLSIPYDKDIIVKHATLRSTNTVKDYFMLFRYWVQYNPLSYIVVNRIEANKMLPFYAQPFVFIIGWMFISVLIVRLFLKKNTFFFALVLSWLFIEFFNINNMAKVTSWTNNVYANDMKINVDQKLYDIAMRVKNILKLDIDQPDKLKQTKVLVLSSDKYHRARIIYHMLPVNSSFLDINLEIITQSKVSKGDYILSMSLENDLHRPLNGQLVFPKKSIAVKEVWHDNIVSIMEVL
ncbi:MAG: hypothetical protein AB8B80_06015 [Marinicellaceae bacterium]